MAVVNIRGDRLYHEHITWDHASALRQIGVLPEKLPLTISTEEKEDDDDDEKKKKKKEYEITLPVAGKETAMKMRNKNSIPSNSMFEYQAREIWKYVELRTPGMVGFVIRGDEVIEKNEGWGGPVDT